MASDPLHSSEQHTHTTIPAEPPCAKQEHDEQHESQEAELENIDMEDLSFDIPDLETVAAARSSSPTESDTRQHIDSDTRQQAESDTDNSSASSLPREPSEMFNEDELGIIDMYVDTLLSQNSVQLEQSSTLFESLFKE